MKIYWANIPEELLKSAGRICYLVNGDWLLPNLSWNVQVNRREKKKSSCSQFFTKNSFPFKRKSCGILSCGIFPLQTWDFYHLSQVTATSTLDPNWTWTLSEDIWSQAKASAPLFIFRSPLGLLLPMWQDDWWADVGADGNFAYCMHHGKLQGSHNQSGLLRLLAVEPSHRIYIHLTSLARMCCM